MSRAARQLAVDYLLAFGGVAVGFAALWVGLAGFAEPGLVHRLGVVPSGVWLALPIGWLAALLLVVHLRRSGDLRALAVGGARPARQAGVLAVTAATLAVVLGVALPGELAERDREPGPLRPRAALDGSLALGERFTWWADEAAPRVAPPGARFVERPRHAGRFRVRLLLARPPWRPSEHPLDPQAWRWLAWALGGIAVPWWIGTRALAGRFGWG